MTFYQKKKTIFLLFLLIHFTGFAQKGKLLISAYPVYGYGFFIHDNVEDYYYWNGRSPKCTNNPSDAYAGVCHVGYMLSEQMGFVTGIAWNNSSWQMQVDDESRHYKKTSQQSIQIPLLFRVTKNLVKGVGYYIETGCKVSFLQGFQDNIIGYFDPTPPKEISKTAMSIELNTVFDIKLHKSLYLLIGLNNSSQVTNNFTTAGLHGYLFSCAVFSGLNVKL